MPKRDSQQVDLDHVRAANVDVRMRQRIRDRTEAAMNEKLLNPSTLRQGNWLERMAWLLMQLTGVPLAVADACLPGARQRAR